MLQLIYPSSGTTNPAVYLDAHYTGSQVRFYVTSSFTGDVTQITTDIISNKTKPDGGWILVEMNRSSIPTKSGQYFTNIYGLVTGAAAVWATTTDAWEDISDSWLTYSEGTTLGDKVADDRVIVSGSDYDDSYKYEFEDNSNYTVYNG